ncbi:transposase, partial [Salmonella enterica subsp. enterica serovar Oslo]|nr:transposase [Salmonella enterica]EEJ2343648.1 transposase [Salmonella enterica subsp. enterica serovar Oslo]
MFFSVNDLTGVPGLPGTVQGIRWTLNRATEQYPEWRRKRAGTKAFEYHIDCLPAEVQKFLRDRQIRKLLNDASEPAIAERLAGKNIVIREELANLQQFPALVSREVQALTDKQRLIIGARCLLCEEVDKLREHAGMGRNA